MNIDVSHHGGKTIVKLCETRLDAALAVRFKDGLKGVVDEGINHMILDMSEVGFMDSSGLGAVVAHMKYMGSDRQFEIAGLTPTVEKVFKLTRMDNVFTIYTNAQDALGDEIQEAG